MLRRRDGFVRLLGSVPSFGCTTAPIALARLAPMTETAALLPLVVFVPFVAAGSILLLGRIAGNRTGLLMAGSAAFAFAGAALLAVTVMGGPPVVFAYDWIPALAIQLRFRADPFGVFFALLISGIGVLIGVYSLAYIPALDHGRLDRRRLGRYYAALAGFMGAMLGIALADDLILLFVFWEITSITSFILIGFWYEEDRARAGAVTALLVTALGGLAMMAGFILRGDRRTLRSGTVLFFVRRLARKALTGGGGRRAARASTSGCWPRAC